MQATANQVQPLATSYLASKRLKTVIQPTLKVLSFPSSMNLINPHVEGLRP